MISKMRTESKMKKTKSLIVTTLATVSISLTTTVTADKDNDCRVPRDKFHWVALASVGIESSYIRSIEKCKTTATSKQYLERIDLKNMLNQESDLAFRNELNQHASERSAQPINDQNMSKSITTVSDPTETLERKKALPRAGNTTNIGVLK